MQSLENKDQDIVLFQLVSGQLMPNYIAHKIIRPVYSVYLHTKDTIGKIEACKVPLELSVNNYHEIEIEAFDWEKAYQVINLEILKDIYKGKSLKLNWTSGTKISADAAKQVFIDHQLPYFYCNTESQEIYYFKNNKTLNREKYERSFITFQDLVKINAPNFLFNVSKNNNDDPGVKKINDFMYELFVKQSKKGYDKLITIINKELSSKNPKKEVSLLKKRIDNDYFSAELGYERKRLTFRVWDIISETTLIDINNETDNYGYMLKALTGGWFEQLVMNILDETKIFKTLSLNNKITGVNKENKEESNEYDICGMTSEGFPAIFECKSGSVNSTDIDKFSASKKMYFGTYSKLIVISFFPVNREIVKSKLKSLNIDSILFNELKSKSATDKKIFIEDKIKNRVNY